VVRFDLNISTTCDIFTQMQYTTWGCA